MEDFWQEHQRLGPLQRWMQALRHVVLTHREQPVVIFVDEIDVVRSLQQFSTDEFFAAIRECYNRRSADPAFNRLTFCLLGVATPSDLIQDTRTTPFKIGRRIELEDFTPAEAAPLATGLGRDEAHAGKLLKRILYWTGGHPYLTQRLCQAVARDASIHSAAGVDRLCEEMFLSTRARERDDNLLFVRERLLARDYDRATLLDLYRQVRERKRIRDDDTSSLISVLRLAGIVRVLEGYLWVRNRIYFRVFDREWIIANMPDAEIRRQQAAFRRGMIRASVVAAVIITCLGGGIYWYLDWYVLEHTVYYNPFAKRWGVPQGIGELTPEQVKGRAVSLKFSSKGRKGPVQKVQAVNDKDECNPQHEVGTYFKPETQSQITPYRECQWEFVRDLRGEIVYEMAYCSGRRSIPMRCRRCGTSAATFARGRSSDVEHQEYLDSLASAVCLQLQVPLGATGDSRGLLVDAYFAAEIWPSGSKKLFIRTDREHTFLHQGFALMGLYTTWKVSVKEAS